MINSVKKPLQNNVYNIAFHRCHNCVEVMSWPVILCRDMTTGCTAHQSPHRASLELFIFAPLRARDQHLHRDTQHGDGRQKMEDRRWRRWKTTQHNDFHLPVAGHQHQQAASPARPLQIDPDTDQK